MYIDKIRKLSFSVVIGLRFSLKFFLPFFTIFICNTILLLEYRQTFPEGFCNAGL